jgi:hypothetical protein
MPARFDDRIPYFFNPAEELDDVIAIGPLHTDDEIKEVCAWIYQPTSVQGRDAAATEMHFGHDHDHNQAGSITGPAPPFQQDPGARWLLRLKRNSKATFKPGQAFAVAVALIFDRNAPDNERVVWWGQPVELFEDKTRVLAAQDHDALLHVPLKTPA